MNVLTASLVCQSRLSPNSVRQSRFPRIHRISCGAGATSHISDADATPKHSLESIASHSLTLRRFPTQGRAPVQP
jgi:hypothetical protein